MNSILPRARASGLVIKELDDEVLVYDLITDQAHCLNQTAARVWKYCDGRRSVAELRALMEEEAGAIVSAEIVWLALDQLGKFRLLETAPTKPEYLSRMRRREVIRHIGVVPLALPLIISMAAPTAAQGGSPCSCTGNNCRPAGCPCDRNVDCASKCTLGFCN